MGLAAGTLALTGVDRGRAADPPLVHSSSITTGTWSEGWSSRPLLPVGPGRDQPLGQFGRQQRVVDPKAAVARPGAGLVVPERVHRPARMQRAHRVGQPEPAQCPEPRPALGMDQGVAFGQRTGGEVVGVGQTLKSPARTRAASASSSARARAIRHSIQRSL